MVKRRESKVYAKREPLWRTRCLFDLFLTWRPQRSTIDSWPGSTAVVQRTLNPRDTGSYVRAAQLHVKGIQWLFNLYQKNKDGFVSPVMVAVEPMWSFVLKSCCRSTSMFATAEGTGHGVCERCLLASRGRFPNKYSMPQPTLQASTIGGPRRKKQPPCRALKGC